MKKNYLSFLISVLSLSIFIPDLKAKNASTPFLSTDMMQVVCEKSFIQAAEDPIINTQLSEAVGAFNEVYKSDKFTDGAINANDLTQLPIGIRETRNSVEYGIVVTKAKFTPEYALINVYARIVTPQKGVANGKKELYFGAEGIKLSYSGGIIGDAKLSLLGDIEILFNNNQWMLTLEGGKIAKENEGGSFNEKTFVMIGCDGVKELSLKGNIQISKDVLVPIDENGRIDERATINIAGKTYPNRVRGDFFVKANDWNDLIVEVGLTPFAITAQTQNENKGYFSFFVSRAVLDMSDNRAVPGMVFPRSYIDNGYLIAGEQTWRGLFIQTLEVKLPEEFKSSKSDKLISFDARNMIIDSYGVSGSFAADNVLSINEGITSDQNAWSYSVDRIGIDLAASKLIGGVLEGQIQLPVQQKKKADSAQNKAEREGLAYRGMITEDDYLLSVALTNNLDFDIWSAKAVIAPGSSVEMRVTNRRFLPKAILSGYLDIAASAESDTQSKDSTKKELRIRDVEFQELTLQTVAPYVTVKYFGAKGEHRLANFPVSIDDIVLIAENNRTELGFGITVGLQDKGFSAGGVISITGEIENVNSRQQWKYKGFNVSKLSLNNVDIKVATISGEIELMRKDPLYGDGFRGMLAADIKGGIKVQVDACFGYSKFRYWGFEGSVDGLHILTPIGVEFTGFTGGAFYRMTPGPVRNVQDKTKRALVFTPDEKVGLGLRAGVYGAFKKKEVASFMASFNISTNANGGLANMGFMGEVYIMDNLASSIPNPFEKLQDKFQQVVQNKNFIKDIAEHNRIKPFLDVKQVDENYPTEKTPQSKIYGKLAMDYDFNNAVFHANMDVFVNTPGNFITGLGNNGRAGWAVMHLASNEWYLHVGTPTDMIGLKVGIGKFSVQSGSYFMVGTNIPASPAPPAEVAKILGVQLNEIDYMKELNTIGAGSGFAFGTHFKFDTGDMTALMFYARFQAGIGGDVMLKNYGEAACSNRGGRQIGINGWYANGQAYAYLQGELGIKIRLFALKKKIPIISSGAGTLLQMKGPNPFWMRGYVAGNYNLLGGLVKGNYRFKLEFGEECKLENESVLGGMKIISDLTPRNDEKDVNVFAVPQATFAMKVNEAIEVPEDDGNHIYKIVIDRFAIEDENGKEIQGKIEVGRTGDVANFVSTEILPPAKKMKAIVEVSFMERKNGIYEVIMVDGKKATEREERYFVTGTAPTNIPLSNVQYAYPVVEQQNFYTKESKQGFIRLKRGQSYLFEDGKWKTIAQFRSTDGRVLPTNFSYNVSENEIRFNIPELENTKQYTFSIAAKTEGSATDSGHETVTQKTTYANTEQGITMETETKQAQNIAKDGSIERLSFDFRTSKYNTLASKIGTLNFSTQSGRINSSLVFLQNTMNNAGEAFDVVELRGSAYTGNKPLISVTATMDDAFAARFKHLVYDGYPVEGIKLTRESDTNDMFGIPPVKALPLVNSYLIYLDTQSSHPILKSIFPFKYDLFRIYQNDWYETMSKAVDLQIDRGNVSPKISELAGSNFGVIPDGKYSIYVNYTLPDGKAASEKKVVYDLKTYYIGGM
ncbi:MAG: hypothetical protein Q4G63_10580 [Bacteroidia bacterium]|nr:hypothetical protein [Bacteroidia bacterium]